MRPRKTRIFRCVPALIVFVLFALMIILVSRAANAANRKVKAEIELANTGIPAQGILLQVAPTGTRTLINGYRYERRAVVLDVERPGQEPYQLAVSPLFPVAMLRSVLPGVSVLLRVDPKDSQKVAVVSPGNLPPGYLLGPTPPG